MVSSSVSETKATSLNSVTLGDIRRSFSGCKPKHETQYLTSFKTRQNLYSDNTTSKEIKL